MSSMTNEELLAGGAILGAALGTIITCALIFYVLVIIAGWKIFTKAGEKGWKAIIPVYNIYIFYKISGVNFWIWCFIPVLVYSIFSALIGDNDDPNVILAICLLASCVYTLVGTCKFCKGLATAFGRGTGFAVGLFFLPNIFQLILGFGSSKYVK